MNKIVVQSSSHAYHIEIGEDIRLQLKKFLPKQYSSVMIISDNNVADLYLDDIRENFINDRVFEAIIPSGEQTKSIEYFYQLQTEAIENGLDRQALIIALGGGVIGDLAGFVASTFLRGIDYIQIPTTILAHDSSVGGKVAINHELGKNLIGSFYPPKAVIYDVNTLQTLSDHEVRSGYAELMKEALIADEKFYQQILATDITNLSTKQLKDHLRNGIQIKAAIVEADEKESGDRMFLNLGHTLGHALEAELGYGKLTHGEAVAIGLLFALRVSEQHFSTKLPYDSLLQWLKKNNYPLTLPTIKVERLIAKMKLDKKVVNETIQMVLIKNIGKPIVTEINDSVLTKYLTSFLGELVK